jgi:hypothetical protein
MTKQAASKATDFLLGLFFNPKDGGACSSEKFVDL